MFEKPLNIDKSRIHFKEPPKEDPEAVAAKVEAVRKANADKKAEFLANKSPILRSANLKKREPIVLRRNSGGPALEDKEPEGFGEEKPKPKQLTAEDKAARAKKLRDQLMLPDNVRKKLGDDGPLGKLKERK